MIHLVNEVWKSPFVLIRMISNHYGLFVLFCLLFVDQLIRKYFPLEVVTKGLLALPHVRTASAVLTLV